MLRLTAAVATAEGSAVHRAERAAPVVDLGQAERLGRALADDVGARLALFEPAG